MNMKNTVYAHGLYAAIVLPFVLLIVLRVGPPECRASEEPADANNEASAGVEPENVTSTEEVEVIADSAKVKVGDEVIASIKKGERFAVNRRQGPWVGIVVESAGEERLGWVLANRVQTVVEAEGGESSTAPGPPEFLRVSVDSTQMSDSKSQRQMRRPDGRTYAVSSSVKAIYLRLSVNNRDINAAPYDASQFALQVDGQTLRHVACKSRSYSEKIYSAGNATAPRDPAELEYLQTGQISAGGSVDGWLRFELPSVREVRDLAKKTWRLSGKVGENTFSVDLLEAELKALAAKVRPSTVDAAVQVVEIGGTRINGLNVGRFLDLIGPLVTAGKGLVVVLADENCIVDSLAAKVLQWPAYRPRGSRAENLLVWADVPQAFRERLRLDSMDIRIADRSISYSGRSPLVGDRDFRQLVLFAARLRATPSELFAARRQPVARSETSAVIWVLGKRQGTGKMLATHLASPQPETRTAAATALATHTAEADVVDALVKAAADENAGTRSEAVFSLASSEDPKATDAIQRAMSDPDAGVRCAAALAADSDRGEKIVESLIDLLDDPDVSVAMAACASLGTLKAEKAVESIRKLQSAEETHFAAAAIDALKAIGSLTTLEAARAKLGIVRLFADELVALAEAKDKADVPKIISVMQSVRKQERYYSDQLVKVLADIGDPQAVEPLIGLLRPGDSEYSILDENPLPLALGKLGDKRAVKPLEEALASVTGSQRYPFYVGLLMLEAAGALDRVSTEIEKKSNSYELRKLLEILAQSGHPQAVPLIEPALDSRQHHRSATLSLLHIGTPAALEAIKKRLLARDYPHAQAVVSEVGSRLVAVPMTAQQIRELLEQRLSLLGELADSPNSVVQDNVPRYVASLEQSLVAGDLKTFLAHVSDKEFDAADKAFQEFVTKYVAAVGDTPSQAGYITRGFSTMQSAYARAEQAERAEEHFAKAISAIEEIAKKPDAPDLGGLLIDLRGIKVVSALSADRQVKEEDIRQLVDDLKTHLSAKAAEKLTTTDLNRGASLAGALERTSRTELAQETYDILAKTASRSKKESLARAAQTYATKARRLGLIGKEMKIEGTTLDGKAFDWASYRGKVVLIDFWTSWCPHCWPEIKNARKAYELYHDRGFDVVGINLDEDTNKMHAYLAKEKIPWTILHTKGAGWKHPVAVDYGIRSVPTMFLVDRDGKVVTDNARGKKLHEFLNDLIGPPGSAAPTKKTPSAMDAVYAALRLSNARVLGGPHSPGDTIRITYELRNTSKTDLLVPLDSSSSRPTYLVGVLQHWIEREGADSAIPTMPARVKRVGAKYAAGGSVTRSKRVIPAGESLTFQRSVDTAGYPAGKYTYYIDYMKLRGGVFQTEKIGFELTKE
ncbi:MAG: HEAT repeat domain-containing protein [Planctomycetes bacterium]|nr:HEAT repeat domain-containing protein [Planctomycetota bacterium]